MESMRNIRNAIFGKEKKKKNVFSGLAKAPLQLARTLFLLTVFAQKPKSKCSSRLNCTLALDVFPLVKLRDACQTVLAAQISLLYKT